MSKIGQAMDHFFSDLDNASLRIDRLTITNDEEIEAKLNVIKSQGWEILSEVTHSRRSAGDRDKIEHYLLVMSKKGWPDAEDPNDISARPEDVQGHR